MMRGKDSTQQLADYIKKNVSKGYTLESLRWALVSQGHSRVQVDKALFIAKEQIAAETAKTRKIELPQQVAPVEAEPMQLEKKSFWSRLFG